MVKSNDNHSSTSASELSTVYETGTSILMDNPSTTSVSTYLSSISEPDSACNNCATAHQAVGVAQGISHLVARKSTTQVLIASVGLVSHVVISALGCVSACEVRADEAY